MLPSYEAESGRDGDTSLERRNLLFGAVVAITNGFFASPEAFAGTSKPRSLSAGENLMQDHGILGRALLIYAELARRLRHDGGDPDNCLLRATDILVSFIQGHHERLEELLIFPVLRRTDRHAELVATLVAQHGAGHQITKLLRQKMTAGAQRNSAGRVQVAELLESYVAMFRPHALREDTVVFPALHELLSPQRYDELSLKVQAMERRMVHYCDLDDLVRQLSEIEQALDICDLNRFTARAVDKT